MRVSLLLLSWVVFSLAAENTEWHYSKIDPHTKKHLLTIDAKAFERTQDSSVLLLRNVTAYFYASNGSTYKEVSSVKALLNEKAGTLTYGPDLSQVVRLK